MPQKYQDADLPQLVSGLVKMGEDLRFALTLAEVALNIASQQTEGGSSITITRLNVLLNKIKKKYRR